jgi:hypothetical protein
VEDLEYLEEEEGLMVAAAAAVLAVLEALVDLTVSVLVAALTAMMDSEAVVADAEDVVVVMASTGTANNNGRV